MPPKRTKKEEMSDEENLHPFVSNHLDSFETLYELTCKIKSMQQEVQEMKRHKLELEQQICEAIMEELDEDEKHDVIIYKTLAVQYTNKPVLQIGKRSQKKE
jgi:hypothetical protein